MMRIVPTLLACVFLLQPIQLRASPDGRLVVAHWIVPMGYSENEDPKLTLVNDVRAATELGVDAFALDAFTGAQAKHLMDSMSAAIDTVGNTNLKFFLSADVSQHFRGEEIVDAIASYARNPHYLQVRGHPFLSTYGGEKLGNDWWDRNVLAALKSANLQVTFVPYFDRPNPNGDAPSHQNWSQILNRNPSVDGLFNFIIPGSTPFYSSDANIGHHWWSVLEADEALGDALREAGKIYMASALPYYWAVCHPARQYVEFQGGRGMDNLWTSLITKQQPDIVQLVTWNDYSESTFYEPTRFPKTKTPGIPSMPHLGYYELLKYYISWYHTGSRPLITKDAVFFFYRTHSADAVATNDPCKLGPIPSNQKWGSVQDVIYVTTALTAPAELKVTIGGSTQTMKVSSGVNTVNVPFSPGKPTFELWRGNKKLTGITGAEIVSKPVVYNFNVYSGYSIASGVSSDTWLPQAGNSPSADWFDSGSPRPSHQ